MTTHVQTQIPRRDPAQVMRLARLGSFHQSRLSFMRILTRRMVQENWSFSTPVFEIDAQGVGHAVLCAQTPTRVYALVAFAHDLPAEKRSDRVIADAWDCTFTLFDGMPSGADIARLRQNIPLQEAGRVTEKELSVSRANRSVRLWEHVVSRLAEGRQPDVQEIKDVGYLMRTTAVYGSGKLGAADRELLADRPEFVAPFQVEMLSVYLTRAFVRDLAQHLANLRGGARATCLAPDIARLLGVGNSTGLGMAPFLLNHPKLFNNWIAAREEALARVRSLPTATAAEVAVFRDVLARAIISADCWQSAHPIQVEKLAVLRADLDRLKAHVASADLSNDQPWQRLFTWAEQTLGVEAQECLASLMFEPYGALVDPLAAQMSDTDAADFYIDGTMRLDALRAVLDRCYGWAMDLDWEAAPNVARLWYVSEEKLEPRLGERFAEPLADYEQPLAPARDAVRLRKALDAWDANETVAAFLLKHPEHRHSVRRAQIVARAPYAEIRDNTIAFDLLPIDMLRCKLSFFGATHFDPRSDRWVRVCLFGNAPYPEELARMRADDWPYPPANGVLA
ncbi:MAG: hypothetical protein P8J02_05830 [Yoonia sp.]|nr:hypothetical protein [Yoonia sp.]